MNRKIQMKGETLIEVLIALSVAVIVITSISFLSVSSLNNSAFVKDQNQASKYAQEGIEVARSIRNSDYTGFAAYSGTYCLAKDQTAFGSVVASCQTPNIEDQYIRSVTITQNDGCGAGFANVLVTVSWTSTKCSGATYCHSSEVTSCFSTTSPVSGP